MIFHYVFIITENKIFFEMECCTCERQNAPFSQNSRTMYTGHQGSGYKKNFEICYILLTFEHYMQNKLMCLSTLR